MILALLAFLQLANAAPKPVTVDIDFRGCSKDSECESVPLRCGCCQYGAVAKVYATEYLDSTRDAACIDEPCKCQPLKLVPRCVKSRCELVDPHAKPAKAKPKKKPKRKKKKKTIPKTVPAG